jgi:hypothetical protein
MQVMWIHGEARSADQARSEGKKIPLGLRRRKDVMRVHADRMTNPGQLVHNRVRP